MRLPCQRDQFDLPENVVYLNCAYMGPLTRRVRSAGIEALSGKSEPWNLVPEDFFNDVERARQLFAQVVGGDPEGVALVPSVSYGIATAARNLPVAEGSEIIVLAEQFPSNVYAWQELARKAGARLRTIARPYDGDWTREVLAAIGPQTALAALPNCHWTDGTLIDLEAVGAGLRQFDAALVVDGCQSVGALPINVQKVQPDFLVTASYKWLLGPYSHGFLWVAPRWREGEPLEHNWIGRANSRDFAALVNYTDQFSPGARRFDVGEVSNFALLPAAVAALEQTLSWGVDAIQETLRQLIDAIADGAQALGLGVAPPTHRAGHMIGLRLGGRDPRVLAATLAEARVYVSVRGDSVRISPHVYNDRRDVERFLEVLAGALAGSSDPEPVALV
jgi:selenocysteine lyase/cysteine desulfurase